ncbi:hypothetical protein N836_00215 [Leptolyngbya sp. Heron Island J]|uniref:hypothetical protein n=1 Tax=Leptolyngbya sp. Heron Island J TaxID=1385935 RepID=UPI0003B99DE5|nr:hypothetical protein [Leptolyngbya sp. Heron Island J]ESA37137.1 hypothetical protein N836_00215 [Leptolyngbya sp. Heron Island J]
MSWKNWGDHPVVVTIGVVSALCAIVGGAYAFYTGTSTEPYEPIENSVFNTADDSQITDSQIRGSSETNGDGNITGDGNVTGEGNIIQSDSPGGVINSTQGDNSPNVNNAQGDVTITYGAKKNIAKFEGKIVDISTQEDTGFSTFLYDNDNEVVFIDGYIDWLAVDNDDSDTMVSVCLFDDPTCSADGASFQVGHRCPEDVPTSLPCSGIYYHLDLSADDTGRFTYVQGAYYLRGYWSVRSNPGLRQGIMSISLLPVEVEDAI